MTTGFIIEPLASCHNRTSFCSGAEPLDRYFQSQATQDVRKRAANCYIAIDSAKQRIAGYYTLSAAHVVLSDLSEAMAKRVPRYPTVPVGRLGRLAVDQASRGLKLGAALLWDAAMRTVHSNLMVFALQVDAQDDQTEAFYRHHGFVACLSGCHPHPLHVGCCHSPEYS